MHLKKIIGGVACVAVVMTVAAFAKREPVPAAEASPQDVATQDVVKGEASPADASASAAMEKAPAALSKIFASHTEGMILANFLLPEGVVTEDVSGMEGPECPLSLANPAVQQVVKSLKPYERRIVLVQDAMYQAAPEGCRLDPTRFNDAEAYKADGTMEPVGVMAVLLENRPTQDGQGFRLIGVTHMQDHKNILFYMPRQPHTAEVKTGFQPLVTAKPYNNKWPAEVEAWAKATAARHKSRSPQAADFVYKPYWWMPVAGDDSLYALQLAGQHPGDTLIDVATFIVQKKGDKITQLYSRGAQLAEFACPPHEVTMQGQLDVDQDGRQDLLLKVGSGAHVLLQQKPDGSYMAHEWTSNPGSC